MERRLDESLSLRKYFEARVLQARAAHLALFGFTVAQNTIVELTVNTYLYSLYSVYTVAEITPQTLLHSVLGFTYISI